MKGNGQYANSSNLEARIQIYQYGESKLNWYDWVWNRMNLRPGMRVLEVGCGSGALWIHNIERIPENISIMLTDLSDGMLTDAKEKLGNGSFLYIKADIKDLPFEDSYFDLVVANHMLYHVPNLDKGISELRRVLRREGRLVASTNSLAHLVELKDLTQSFDPPIRFPSREGITSKFCMENGERILHKHFPDVVLESFDNRLLVTDPSAIVTYVLSLDSAKGILNSDNIDRFTEMVKDRMKPSETFVITTQSCLFTARH